MKTMLEAEIWTVARMDDGTAVVLRPIGSEIVVPIFIGPAEAQAILIGFGDVTIPRPLTHDLLLNLARGMGLDLLRVEVSDLRDNTFYARMIFNQDGAFAGGKSGSRSMDEALSGQDPLVLDARPSDAFALAVRRKCTILIAQKVVDLAGLPVEFFLDAIGEQDPLPPDPIMDAISDADHDARREALLIQLDLAVAEEEYERAAEIRDVLTLLEKESGDER